LNGVGVLKKYASVSGFSMETMQGCVYVFACIFIVI